jgi:adenylate cyclase
MAVEIERKYLVVNDNWKNSVISESVLRQGYIVNQPNVTVRVRIAKGKAQLNIKSATTGITRAEYEYEIPLSDADNILEEIAEQPFIDKTRFKVRCGDHIWDLDVFYGDNSGLVMAEIELDSEEEAFEHPEWAGEEVSGDPRYYNSSLVKKPYSTW